MGPVFITLAALTLAAAEPVKLAAPQLQSAGVDAAKAQFISDFLAQQLSAQGLRVTTRSEIAAVVGLERQRQLLACDEGGTSCISELAGALGVDGIVSGSVAKTEGGNWALTVKIVAARDAAPLALATGRFKSEDALLDFVTEQAPRLAAEVQQALRHEAPSVEPPPATGTERKIVRPYLPTAVAGALLISGAVVAGLAYSDAGAVREGRNITNDAELDAAIRGGKNKESAAAFLLGMGAGIGVSTALWFVFGADAKKRAWLPLAAGGASLVAGIVVSVLARSDESRVRSGTGITNADELAAALSAGHDKEKIGFALLGGGIGALLTGGVQLLLGGYEPMPVAISSDGRTAALTFTHGF